MLIWRMISAIPTWDYVNNKATVAVISIESEPKNIHLFIFLSHLKQLVHADHLMLKTETIGTGQNATDHPSYVIM